MKKFMKMSVKQKDLHEVPLLGKANLLAQNLPRL